MNNRRDFLKKSALLSLTGLVTNMLGNEKLEAVEKASVLLDDEKQFTLPALPYAYDALEPFIDKQTMEIHHTKHHKAYVDKLNTAPKDKIDFEMSDTEKCRHVDQMTILLIRNNLGGHYNHSLFWQLLKPNPEKKPNLPEGKLAEAINKNFKSFDKFKTMFADEAMRVFGSGWCWLVIDPENNLKITSTPNQDNPLMNLKEQGTFSGDKGTPVLALDVWEHAYYLKYQNKRTDYVSNWWNVVNWKKADELFNGK